MNHIDLPGKLKPIREANFRELYHQFLYLHCRDILQEVDPEYLSEEDTGLLVYCYIDDAAGITYRPLKAAQYDGEHLTYRDLSEQLENCLLRYHSTFMKQEYKVEDGGIFVFATVPDADHGFLNLNGEEIDLDQFAEIETDIRNTYDLNNDPTREILRSKQFSYLDPYRNPAHPDQVMVVLFRPDVKPQGVWVRCEFEAEGEIFGTLMTEPKEYFQIKPGTVMGFIPYGEGDDMVLMATGHTSTRLTTD